ncbi:MAG TPA: GGDEF domain-containing protein [Chromatiales bacterium]|nr:GGDEF domain-containing protein [Chromatiales bacterium]
MEHVQNPAGTNAARAFGGDHAQMLRLRPEERTPEALRDHLAGVLQVTLDLACLLELFTAEVRRLVAVDGVAYTHEAEEIDLLEGRAGRHQIRYHLDLEGEDLGEMVFSRSSRFSEEEMDLLERMLFGAVYPVRNALHYRRAQRAAVLDPLTGLYNRAALDALLEREVARAHRYGGALSMLVIDLDHFKQINDTRGHQAGDRLLRAFARLLRTLMRKSDMAFRYGGDEFVVLLPNTDLSGARVLAGRIASAMYGEPPLPEIGRITASIGAATLQAAETPEALFKRADRALYRAKAQGRNRLCADRGQATI